MKSLIKYLSNVFRSGGEHAQSQASLASSKMYARKKEERAREHKERARNVYRRALLHSALCASLTEKAIMRSKNDILRRKNVSGLMDATSDKSGEIIGGEFLFLEMKRKESYCTIDMEKNRVPIAMVKSSGSGSDIIACNNERSSSKNIASRSTSTTTWDFVRNQEMKKEYSLKKSMSDSGIEYEPPSLPEKNGTDEIQLKESSELLRHVAVLLKNETGKQFNPQGVKQYSSYQYRYHHDHESSSNPIYIARRSNDREIQFDENPCGKPDLKTDPDIIKIVVSPRTEPFSTGPTTTTTTIKENPCGRPGAVIDFSNVLKSPKVTNISKGKRKVAIEKKCKQPNRKEIKGKKNNYPWDVSSRETNKRSRTKLTDQSANKVLKLKSDLEKNSTSTLVASKKSAYPWRSHAATFPQLRRSKSETDLRAPKGSKSIHTRRRSDSCSEIRQNCQCKCGCVMCAFGTKCKITPSTCKKNDDRPQASERPRDILCQICHIFNTEGVAGLRSYFRDYYKNKEYYMYTDASYYDVHQHLRRTRNRQPDCRKSYEARFGNDDEKDGS